MPSFDVTSDVNKVELKNAVDQATKEIQTRFDFKGSDARIEQNDLVLTLYGDDDLGLGVSCIVGVDKKYAEGAAKK